MATFIKGLTDQFGPMQLYKPDYQFLTQVYGTRQAEYDRGFSMVRNLYNSVLNSAVTNSDNQSFRQEAFKKLQGALKSVSNVDLSNPTNIMRAQGLIDPISQDQDLAYDMAVTRFHQAQKQKMEQYKNSTDPKIRAMYNDFSKMDIAFAEEDLRNAKAKYVGNFVMQIEKPSTIAGYALNKETQGLPEDFYENYIKNINAVTAEDIKNAANKYFLSEKTRVVIVGKAGDVLPGLEAMSKKEKLPIFYFDKYGNPTEKPEVKKPVPAGVTAQSVLNNYINAIGGEKAVKNVKTLAVYSSGTVQGTALELVVKTTSKKLGVEMKAMGMTMMKQVVNEKGAYVTQQGQRKDLDGDKLADTKESAMPFPELTMADKTTVALDGIESFNGADAYVIKNGKTTLYFDVTSGLKLGKAVVQEANGQKMTQITNYSDYKEVKGIKVPYKVSMSFGPQEIEFKTTDVKINEGVSDADFQ